MEQEKKKLICISFFFFENKKLLFAGTFKNDRQVFCVLLEAIFMAWLGFVRSYGSGGRNMKRFIFYPTTKEEEALIFRER